MPISARLTKVSQQCLYLHVKEKAQKVPSVTKKSRIPLQTKYSPLPLTSLKEQRLLPDAFKEFIFTQAATPITLETPQLPNTC